MNKRRISPPPAGEEGKEWKIEFYCIGRPSVGWLSEVFSFSHVMEIAIFLLTLIFPSAHGRTVGGKHISCDVDSAGNGNKKKEKAISSRALDVGQSEWKHLLLDVSQLFFSLSWKHFWSLRGEQCLFISETSCTSLHKLVSILREPAGGHVLDFEISNSLESTRRLLKSSMFEERGKFEIKQTSSNKGFPSCPSPFTQPTAVSSLQKQMPNDDFNNLVRAFLKCIREEKLLFLRKRCYQITKMLLFNKNIRRLVSRLMLLCDESSSPIIPK